MIDDADKEPTRWDEPIVASNPIEAKRECKKRAEQYGLELESIIEPRKIETHPQVYRCNFKEKT
jgi:hypothetical protein